MLENERLICDILSEVLLGNSVQISDGFNSNEIYDELSNQSLLALTYPWCKKQNSISDDIKKKWKSKYAAQSCRWIRMMHAQQELIRLLWDHGHDLAIIKGFANGLYFPVPELRGSSDIDFLVREEEYVSIYNLLIQNGYTLIGEKRESKHHIALKRGDVVFELHKRPGGTRVQGRYANHNTVQFFQNGLNSISIEKYGTYCIPVLPKVHQALILLLHTAQHMRGGLGLRHILDWMMFANANVDDAFWYSELELIARNNNVDVLAKVMTKMCQNYLGLSKSITWCVDIDDDICERLLNYVFTQGDFGNKVGKSDNAVRVLADSQNMVGFFERLSSSSLYSMPIAKKYVVLRPIAWIYQLVRYLVKLFQNKNVLETLNHSQKEASERAVLFNELGIKLDHN